MHFLYFIIETTCKKGLLIYNIEIYARKNHSLS
jgi:hypothetical protein